MHTLKTTVCILEKHIQIKKKPLKAVAYIREEKELGMIPWNHTFKLKKKCDSKEQWERMEAYMGSEVRGRVCVCVYTSARTF